MEAVEAKDENFSTEEHDTGDSKDTKAQLEENLQIQVQAKSARFRKKFICSWGELNDSCLLRIISMQAP
jgi:hypothetical protein